MPEIAVYTTVFPAVLPFIGDWYRSVEDQENATFDLWIALDGVRREEVVEAVGGDVDATFVEAPADATPATVRTAAWSRMIPHYRAIVMTDADDVLHPGRVRAAAAGSRTVDLVACALRVVDRGGRPTGRTMTTSPDVDWARFLPRANIFGLSNTTYSTTLLASLLRVPPDVRIVDWHLASQAVRAGARLAFDPVPRMDYRRYGGNLVPIAPPLSDEGLARATRTVGVHLERQRRRSVRGSAPPAPAAERFDTEIARRWDEVQTFARAMEDRPTRRAYVAALDALSDRDFAWWEFVAMPELEDLWKR